MDYLDMLAKLGVGNAHPGGFSETIEQLKQYPIKKGSKVLEVGCGTGRTACYLASQGYTVTAIDIREDMIEKAKARAKAENVKVVFKKGDVTSLPFGSNKFDVIMVESVTVFTDPAISCSEYFRVLKNKGVLYDREMLVTNKIPENIKKEMTEFYGFKKMMTVLEWTEQLYESGFSHVEVWKPTKFNSDMWKKELKFPDEHQQADEDAYDNTEVFKAVKRYEELMNAYHKYIGYGVMIGKKLL
ncbi:class I SAM-dependent methyltransferase [Chengkuizengella axinellae]|uniref:Class I SAM-dependent methyltransferase n=1 Tax=Chengkuizengella axinellae TaxID=3064388 RepID=A0ABT9IT53_9BACL|nr:class I SAM-dependent methyltransferase [Chengkuizengella sp. 2205SS18-9]MDP5272502.1 class I SAM-dependent methyltransferase [Chengkuizengella sp. 2205SS18-9]